MEQTCLLVLAKEVDPGNGHVTVLVPMSVPGGEAVASTNWFLRYTTDRGIMNWSTRFTIEGLAGGGAAPGGNPSGGGPGVSRNATAAPRIPGMMSPVGGNSTNASTLPGKNKDGTSIQPNATNVIMNATANNTNATSATSGMREGASSVAVAGALMVAMTVALLSWPVSGGGGGV